MKQCFTVLALLALLPVSHAATLATWDFEGGVAEPSAIAANSTATAVTSQTGSVGFASGNEPTPGAAASLSGFLSGNRYEFTVSATRGSSISLTGISFDDRASGTGPENWSLFANGELIGSGLTSPAFGESPMNAVPLAIKVLAGTVTFWLVGDGASSNSGTWRLDNLVVSGTVSAVPLPLPATLLASALLGLLGFRPRD